MKRMFLILAIMVIGSCAGGFSDDDTANKALSSAGYKNIKTTGYSLFGCDKHDTFSTWFDAVGADGKSVSGVVCSGWFKGATIRTN